jgi:hypothetical protein
MRRLFSTGLAAGIITAYNRKQEGNATVSVAVLPTADCHAAPDKHDHAHKNNAFVFIKPHANTAAVQHLVKKVLEDRKLHVLSEGEISGETIDRKMLVDQHYYAIASKATILKPRELHFNSAKFQEKFHLSWDDAVKEGVVYNALDACKYFGVTADGLDNLWQYAAQSGKLVKLGGGFYCGLIDSFPGKKPIYVLNGFFMSMRSKFVQPGTSIHFYDVEWDPQTLPWSQFRNNVLGATNPKDAPEGSLRGTILRDWKSLGLQFEPNTGENGVHASASPFEGLAERMNWLQVKPEQDAFGKALIEGTGIDAETLQTWSLDPQVKGKSLFDSLEDLDADACVAKAKELLK